MRSDFGKIVVMKRCTLTISLLLLGCSNGPEMTVTDAASDIMNDMNVSDASADASCALPDGAVASTINYAYVVFVDQSDIYNTRGWVQSGFVPAGTPDYANVATFGACTMTQTQFIGGNAIDGPGASTCPLPRAANAGIIAVAGGSLPPPGLSTELGPQPTQSNFQVPIFEDGDSLSVVAEGGTIPPFSGTVVGSGCVYLTSPFELGNPFDGGTTYIPTSSDLTLSWTGGESNATVHVYFVSQRWSDTQSNVFVETDVACNFAASAGTGLVPEQALAELTGGSPSLSNYMGIYQQRVTALDAGAWNINLYAWNLGHPADGGVCTVPGSAAIFAPADAGAD